MLKAQHAQLVQQASNDLVDIRYIEINYYVQFFTNIGIQSAFIAGYQFSTISQVARIQAESLYYQYAFWLTSVICICLSLESLLVSLYLVVFGQGLALRGPAGSMIKAINAFQKYQQHVLLVFSMTIASVGVSTMCEFFVFMDFRSACIAAILMAVGMWVWWTFCLQVYNQFQFIAEPVTWRGSIAGQDGIGPRRDSEANPADTMEIGTEKRNWSRDGDNQEEQSDAGKSCRTDTSSHPPSQERCNGQHVHSRRPLQAQQPNHQYYISGDHSQGHSYSHSQDQGQDRGIDQSRVVSMKDVSWRRKLFSKFHFASDPKSGQDQGSRRSMTLGPQQYPADSNYYSRDHNL